MNKEIIVYRLMAFLLFIIIFILAVESYLKSEFFKTYAELVRVVFTIILVFAVLIQTRILQRQTEILELEKKPIIHIQGAVDDTNKDKPKPLQGYNIFNLSKFPVKIKLPSREFIIGPGGVDWFNVDQTIRIKVINVYDPTIDVDIDFNPETGEYMPVSRSSTRSQTDSLGKNNHRIDSRTSDYLLKLGFAFGLFIVPGVIITLERIIIPWIDKIYEVKYLILPWIDSSADVIGLLFVIIGWIIILLFRHSYIRDSS